MPSSQLNTEEVFEDKATVDAALSSIYADMRDGSIVSDLSYNLGLYADELDLYGMGTTNASEFYENALTPADSKVKSWWNSSYFLIYSANSIIENIEISSQIKKEDSDQIKGEALFVRAFLHYNLSLLYGNIPYITTTNYIKNLDTHKSTEAEILKAAEQDLIEAISLLPMAYLNPDRTRPNRAVAMMLLSRICRDTKNWSKVIELTTAIIEQTDLYTWENMLDHVFLKESRSTLWQWYPKFDGNNTTDGNLFIFTTNPPSNVALNQNLVDSFEQQDFRLSHWIQAVTDDLGTWYHPFKYKEKGSSEPTREYAVVFRLAEAYLIRSEARAELGNIEGALLDINQIRNRAGLGDLNTLDKESLLSSILEERRHELFTESGHRFFDLKRNQIINEVLNPIKPGWDATDQLLPIPQEELELNPNLEPQNPGY
ncbi:RagB/SusD family nutrient uptake outer membrane protein [Formosa sp. 3Alg 14/1]|uniref:RagB/SusD family nutrient uptake outer membrane protein n=1 Tax=Formosa sp. 3Alg 14/1 TaxID=3382190 RepID=UPI0039BE2047